MNAITDFFKRLQGIHLLFWELSFGFFDAIPLFTTILAIVGANDILQTKSINGVSRAVLLQFILYILSYVFCYAWRAFRNDLVRNANNMICLSLTISFLSCLLVIVMQLFLSVSPLKETIGLMILRFSDDLRDLVSWDSKYSFAIIFFAISYLLIFINTLYVRGGGDIWNSTKSENIVPLVVSFAISLIASLIVMWPVFLTMNI